MFRCKLRWAEYVKHAQLDTGRRQWSRESGQGRIAPPKGTHCPTDDDPEDTLGSSISRDGIGGMHEPVGQAWQRQSKSC